MKRSRRFGSDSDEDEAPKRPRMSEASTVARPRGGATVQQQQQQRSAAVRQRGSRTSRWLSDSDDDEGPSNQANPYLNSAEENNGSDEEFTLSRRSRPAPLKKPVPKRSPTARSGKCFFVSFLKSEAFLCAPIVCACVCVHVSKCTER